MAIAFGLALAVLGPLGYFGGGEPAVIEGEADAEPAKRSLTAWIPTVFGALLIVCGVVAQKEEFRKHAMHAAAAIAVIGFLLAGGRVGMVLATGRDFGWAATMVSLMALLCLVFVGLCVRSFVAARKAQDAAG